ncbi:hypothetical protein [Streptococcus sp. DD13]|uniref:hypothetical protein n=1 Tax=Streptococcus sp. DD13 TaxID=1777881 RepID=UPI00079523A2|nr:hypothetical protein [Streptococcus sp. DD13]KXT77645.1 hypothetical protein STRDD13_01325 [Streptococcus sp. DD13]
MKKELPTRAISFLLLALWSGFRIWSAVQDDADGRIILWSIFAVINLGLFVCEWRNRRKRYDSRETETGNKRVSSNQKAD